MLDKQRAFTVLLRQGVSISEACRRLGVDRKTGHWWKNGGTVTRNGVTRVVAPVLGREPEPVASDRYLSERERVVIADGVRAGRSARSIATELGRAASTVAREVKRNTSARGEYRPHTAHALMLARRPRPKPGRFALDVELRSLVQGYLDQRWSPEQVAHELVAHGHQVAVETIYRALYSPLRLVQREPSQVLRTGRAHRRPRRRGDQRRPRFIVPITLIDERPPEAEDRMIAGHWEGDLIVGAFNRSAIATLVERTSRFAVLLHLGDGGRADALRDGLAGCFGDLPPALRRSLTWDQGSEMCHHHRVAQSTGMPVFFCHPGRPWQRPSNENTNGLLRQYFPKKSDLSLITPEQLLTVAGELNQRPRRALGWQTPHEVYSRAVVAMTA